MVGSLPRRRREDPRRPVHNCGQIALTLPRTPGDSKLLVKSNYGSTSVFFGFIK